jgi:AraC family transcriptional regulator
VISRALSGDVVSPLWFEESVLNLLRHALHNAYAERRVQFAPREQSRLSIHEEIIHRAEAAMAKHFRESAHCNTLRLRAALEYVPDTSLDLTQISCEVGFSSHSHFTWAFKRQFGVAPSSFRLNGKKKKPIFR